MIEPEASVGSEDTIDVAYCGEWSTVKDGSRFTVGREGDLALDDNPFLHRSFLSLHRENGLWWLSNIGTRLSATVTDASGGMQAWLNPGGRLPIVFPVTSVIFSAGPTTYEFSVHASSPAFRTVDAASESDDETIGAVSLTESQRLLILALAEPLLRQEGAGISAIPSSAAAAKRLGWPITRFNRKLDNVCDKLDRSGVPGLRGGPGALATNRKARLVEHAVSSRLVTAEQLPLLDRPRADGA